MRVALIYLTGTGTTAKYAGVIAEGIRRAGHEASCFRFTEFDGAQVHDFDVLGFGAPVYAYRVPRLFTRWLKRLPSISKPFFAFCTCGGDDGNALWNIYKPIAKHGGKYLGGLVGVADTNLRWWRPRLESPPPNDGLTRYSLQAAAEFGERLQALCEELKKNPENKTLRPDRSWKTSLFSLFFTWRWQMAIVEGRKRVEPALCTKCGLCATHICPAGRIVLDQDGGPKFRRGKCIGCEGCLNLCPNLAIWTRRSRNKHPYTVHAEFIFHPPK